MKIERRGPDSEPKNEVF